MDESLFFKRKSVSCSPVKPLAMFTSLALFGATHILTAKNKRTAATMDRKKLMGMRYFFNTAGKGRKMAGWK